MPFIKFLTNMPIGTDIPLIFDSKSFDEIPNTSGVYIVGVKKQINEQVAPKYVDTPLPWAPIEETVTPEV